MTVTKYNCSSLRPTALENAIRKLGGDRQTKRLLSEEPCGRHRKDLADEEREPFTCLAHAADQESRLLDRFGSKKVPAKVVEVFMREDDLTSHEHTSRAVP